MNPQSILELVPGTTQHTELELPGFTQILYHLAKLNMVTAKLVQPVNHQEDSLGAASAVHGSFQCSEELGYGPCQILHPIRGWNDAKQD